MAVFNGTNGDDYIDASSSSDTISGLGGNDILYGDYGIDTIDGGSGIDVIIGSFGDDILTGGTSNDRFTYDEREYGTDTITDFTTGDRIDLSTLGISEFASIAPFLSQVGGDVYLDTFYGGEQERIILQGVTLASITANSFFFDAGTTGRYVDGTSSNDMIFGGRGVDYLLGDYGDDHIIAAGGADTLIGSEGDDILTGGASSDRFTIVGRRFDIDRITDFAGGDRIDVRALGVGDLASLTPFMIQVGANVEIRLGFAGDTETIIIENRTVASLTATQFVFDLDTGTKTMFGTSSADVLFGGRGADYIYGNFGNDIIVAGSGNDRIEGSYGDDTLTGGGNSDIFIFSERDFGDDIITDFGPGDKIDLTAFNVSSYADLAPFLVVNNNDIIITLGWGSDAETIRIVGGAIPLSPGGLGRAQNANSYVFDTSTLPAIVEGSSSADVLFGGLGADRITGYGGRDMMTGGAGADRFLFDDGYFGSSNNATAADVIMDFDSAQGDVIDLSAVDANYNLSTDQAFSFIGTAAFSGVAGQLRYQVVGSDIIVTADQDGNLTADLIFTLRGVGSLAATDFAL